MKLFNRDKTAARTATDAAPIAPPAIPDETGDDLPDDLRQITGELSALLGVQLVEWRRTEGDERAS